MVTTTSILLECGNAAARRPYRLDVFDLRAKMSARQCLIDPTPDDVELAWSEYRSASAAAAGIVDQISFAVMRRLGVSEAFTNDHHYVAAGFRPLF
ncbi:MAG: hypothetical protein FJ303_26655 [Planctomycetes bacterium]|nr:hypothetical protein [Planctomycetota bacterium]